MGIEVTHPDERPSKTAIELGDIKKRKLNDTVSNNVIEINDLQKVNLKTELRQCELGKETTKPSDSASGYNAFSRRELDEESNNSSVVTTPGDNQVSFKISLPKKEDKGTDVCLMTPSLPEYLIFEPLESDIYLSLKVGDIFLSNASFKVLSPFHKINRSGSVFDKTYDKKAMKELTCSFLYDENGFLPIHAAVIVGQLPGVVQQCLALIAGGFSLDLKNCDGQTPLHMAVQYGEGKITELLLKLNSDPTVKDNEGNTALHLSISKIINDHSLFECFKLLLKSTHVLNMIDSINDQDNLVSMEWPNNQWGGPGDTWWPTLQGDLREIEFKDRNVECFSPLHMAAIYGAYQEATWLIKAGADVNLKDASSGRTALFHAIEQRHFGIMIQLIGFAADENVANMSGQTPYLAGRRLLGSDLAKYSRRKRRSIKEIYYEFLVRGKPIV